MPVLLRLAALFVFALMLAAPISGASAQGYPNRQVTFVVPFGAGGSADTIIRLIGQHLQEKWKQPVIVENKPGAGGNIGNEQVAKAAADGYTLLMTPSSIAIVPHLYNKLSYDPIKGFEPVTLIATQPMVLVVSNDFPAKSVADLIRMAKEKPGGIQYASAGNGTTNHLATELFKVTTGINLEHVPYRNNPQAMPDVIGGRVPVFFDFVLTGAPHVREGKVRALATTGKTRSPVLPDVPTAIESGVKDFEAATWFAIYAPAKTPKDVIDKVNTDVLDVLKIPAMQERFKQLGIEMLAKGPADLAALTNEDFKKWGPVVQAAKIKLD
jgi:tripartite-type tricarboxylate transporter receptor subunit TctC